MSFSALSPPLENSCIYSPCIDFFPPPHGSLKWHYWTYRSLNCLCRNWMTKHTHYFNSRAPDQNNRIFAINITTRWVVCSDVCGRTRVQCFPGFLLQMSGPSAVCEACLLAQLTFIIFPCRWKPGLPVPTEPANIGIELCQKEKYKPK